MQEDSCHFCFMLQNALWVILIHLVPLLIFNGKLAVTE